MHLKQYFVLHGFIPCFLFNHGLIGHGLTYWKSKDNMVVDQPHVLTRHFHEHTREWTKRWRGIYVHVDGHGYLVFCSCL